jgi:large subunit ribosomal protein L31e
MDWLLWIPEKGGCTGQDGTGAGDQTARLDLIPGFTQTLSRISNRRANNQTQKTRSALHDVVTREYTIHLHKRVHDCQFKKSTSHPHFNYEDGRANITEAPNAIKAVKKFAQLSMGVKDVRISPGLNQAVWSRGVKSPPRRIRVRLERKRNDDEGAKEKLYVLASIVEGVTSFKVCPPLCCYNMSVELT